MTRFSYADLKYLEHSPCIAVVHVYGFRRSYVCFCVRCCRQSIVSPLCCISPSYIVFFLLHFSYTIASPTVIICVYQRSRCRQNVNTQPLSSQRDSCVYWYSIFMLSLDANWNAFDMSRSHSHNSLAVVSVALSTWFQRFMLMMHFQHVVFEYLRTGDCLYFWASVTFSCGIFHRQLRMTK